MPYRIDSYGSPQLQWQELAIRAVLITFFIIMENVPSFVRIIQEEEVWLYKYPTSKGYITTAQLYAFTIPLIVGTLIFSSWRRRDWGDLWQGLLAASLALPLNGLITDIIKVTVGRPRPDFFARCYPGVKDIDITIPCTGIPEKIDEGRKSFPSGHSSMAFCSLFFLSLFIAGKLGTFNSRGRGIAWKLILPICPLMIAALVAISRTCDYHHHWQDVSVGAILGASMAYLVYRNYYPSLSSEMSELSYAGIAVALPIMAPDDSHSRP